MVSLADIGKLREEDLTSNIVIPLLKRMGFDSVYSTCGIDEYGRDIVCYYTNPFGDRKWVGVQVKAVVIHGTSRKSGNVQEVIDQIQEAFDNPFYHPTYNTEVHMSEMFVITSKKITPKAKRAIRNKFRQKPVHFVDGQQLASTVEKFIPDLLERYHKRSAIKQRIQRALASMGGIDDIREIEAWFTERESLKLSGEEMDFVSSLICRYFFNNTAIRFGEKVNWDVLSWLKELKGSGKVLSKHVNAFVEDFPYYDEFGSPSLVVSFLKTLKRLKERCPSIYSGVRVDATLFFGKIKKSLDILGYPFNRSILVCLMEDSDVLSDFCDNEVMDLQEEYVLPVLIGMQSYNKAKSYLESRSDFERYFAGSFAFCVNCVLGEHRYQQSSTVFRFAEFLEKSELKSRILPFIPPNYRILLLLALREDKEVRDLLNCQDTFFELHDGNYLPRAYRIFIGKPHDYFVQIANVPVPAIPEVYYEMSELKFDTGDFTESLIFVDIALENADKLKRGWYEKFLKHHKARCLFELGRFGEALRMLEGLIEKDRSSAGFYYSLYEACKKKMGKGKSES